MTPTPASIIDTALDRTVLPGYTSLGFRLRGALRRQAPLPNMEGRTVLVTGGTSGLGMAAAEGFARLGASVHLLARDLARGEHARDEIRRSSGSGLVHVGLGDLSSLESVREFAANFSAEQLQLDVLVNNAGAMLDRRELSVDGVELTFATNVLGPFLLSNLLVPLLLASAPSRIINVSSGGMYTARLDLENLQSEASGYDAPSVYARTKRAEVVLTEQWAKRLAGTGVVAHSMHPGWVDTPGLQASLPRFRRATAPLLRNAAEGADTILWLGASEEAAQSSGLFWHDRRARPTHRVPWTHETPAEQDALWRECERLSGWHAPPGPPSAWPDPAVSRTAHQTNP
jgi:NAD(P)-dependent dehydrogenase (short-subunit alcohol dehydrogenase family)